MNKDAIEAFKQELIENDIEQTLIFEFYNIKYFTNREFFTGERFIGLLLKRDGTVKLFLNELFDTDLSEDIVVKISDSDNVASVLSGYIDNKSPLWVDGKLPSSYLLSFEENRIATKFFDAGKMINRVRSIKNSSEIIKMRESSRINDEAIMDIIPYIKEGVTEKELQEKLKAIYKRKGYDGQFFAIVSFASNSTDPHHMPDDTELKEGNSVLLDIGCRVNGYWSDMTRTWFYGNVSDRYKEIYDIVLKSNLEGERTIKPGVMLSEIDEAARKVISDAGYGKYFTHRLGHQIGLEVHECDDVRRGNDIPVLPGMVFSCEPGIYIPDEGIGIRIEDLCLVTDTGIEILNKVTKDIQVIEK